MTPLWSPVLAFANSALHGTKGNAAATRTIVVASHHATHPASHRLTKLSKARALRNRSTALVLPWSQGRHNLDLVGVRTDL